jgi:hypothetical protein
MMDYDTIQILLTEKNIHFLALYSKADKTVKAVIRPLPGDTSAKDITVALHDIDYDVISVKQMTAKRSIPEGGVTRTSFPLFLVTLATNPKAPETFKLTTLCNKAYTMLQLPEFWSHLGALQTASSLPVVWGSTSTL